MTTRLKQLSAVMAFLVLLVGAVFARAVELPIVKPSDAGMSAQKLGQVNEIMTGLIDKKKIAGGVVIVVRDGKVCFFNAYGQRHREANLPMEKNTIFRIYSMSKAITTAAAMQLYEKGKLKPEDPISKFIPEVKAAKVYDGKQLVAANREVTIADLMRHTSGYTYGKGGAGPIGKAYRNAPPLASTNLEEMAKRLKGIPLAYQPGDKWIYSMSIDILGLVIERASGQKLDAYLLEHIFQPLDMKDTFFQVPQAKVNRFAANYGARGKLIDLPSTSKYVKKVTFFSGGGGLCSTARDYAHFLTMLQNNGELFGKRILKTSTVKLMGTNQLSQKAFPIGFGSQKRDGVGFGYGFAVTVSKSKFDKHRPIGELGWGGAASTHYWMSPKHKLFVVTLEQRMPYTFETETLVKPVVYGATVK